MALDKDKLKDLLVGIFEDMPTDADIYNDDGTVKDDYTPPTAGDKGEAIGNAILSYLEDASVGPLPATGSSINFLMKDLVVSMMKSLFEATPASPGSGITTANNINAAVMAGCSASMGNADGAPIPPGVAIVQEIGAPPIIPPLLGLITLWPLPIPGVEQPSKTVEESADDIATAIHSSITTIMFPVIIQTTPTPAGPVPLPYPPIMIN